MRLLPLNDKENNFLGVKPTLGLKNPNNLSEKDYDDSKDIPKSLRKAQNRDNLVFSKSASKCKLGQMVKNPLEAGFTSRSKSPIAAPASNNKGVKNPKQANKDKNGRWK